MTTQTLTDIMSLVDDLAGARDPLSKQLVATLILRKLCALTGDDSRAEMEKRRAPCAPLKAPSPHRAVRARAESLEQVVEEVVNVLELRKAGM